MRAVERREVREVVQMRNTKVLGLVWSVLSIGCGASSDADMGAAGSGGTQGAGSPAAGSSGSVATTAPRKDGALDEIPSEMRPKTLLPSLQNKLLIPDLESGAVAMFTDIVKVKAGEDVTYCTYMAGTTKSVTYVHDSLGLQSKYGHHAILQYTTTPQPPGTKPCSLESLEAQQGQIIGGVGGEGTSSDAVKLPVNVVSEVPAGAQFIINHHWINTGETEADAQAEMITVHPPAGMELQIARAFSVVVVDFNVPPGQTTEHYKECELQEDMKVLSFLGHQHGAGTHVKAERMGDRADVIFDHAFTYDMVSHPKTRSFPIDAPYELKKGDRVRMTCQWQNPGTSPLTFPGEMCVMFGWKLGGDKDAICLGGNWL